MHSRFNLDAGVARNLERSRAHFERARERMPLGVCDTYRFWGEDRTIYMAKAKGARIWDLDGNEYVDFRLGWGPVILGHGDARVDEKVREALEIGGNSALASPLEIEVAERMSRMVPGAEMVRFANSGTEAVATALRIARAKTGREGFVMVEGAFHGMSDPVLWRTRMEAWAPGEKPEVVTFGTGVPKRGVGPMAVVPYNDLEAFEALLKTHGHEIAAFLVEPILGNSCAIVGDRAWLAGVRSLCDAYGVALIFDEVKTGFRIARGGAQETTGIVPDICTFAKAMANGYPIAAVAGRRAFMAEISGFDGVMHGGTFTGHPIGLAAAAETMRILDETDALDRIADYGVKVQGAMSEVLGSHDIEHVFTGHPAMFGLLLMGEQPRSYRDWTRSDHDLYDAIARKLADFGVLPEPDSREPWFICEAHEEIGPEWIAERLDGAIRVLKR